MFARIASRYDLANHLLSGGVDYWWRARLIRKVAACQPQRVVDLATGSGDVAFALQKRLPATTRIEGYDFCEPMLEKARQKQTAAGKSGIPFAVGDCLKLPIETGSVDAVTIAFGLRNLEDRARGLREMHRILRPGIGRLFVLEFTQPAAWFRPVYYAYLKGVLPVLARLCTGDRQAYEYLAGSIEAFPTKEAVSKEIAAAGFSHVQATGLTAAIVAIHEARV